MKARFSHKTFGPKGTVLGRRLVVFFKRRAAQTSRCGRLCNYCSSVLTPGLLLKYTESDWDIHTTVPAKQFPSAALLQRQQEIDRFLAKFFTSYFCRNLVTFCTLRAAAQCTTGKTNHQSKCENAGRAQRGFFGEKTKINWFKAIWETLSFAFKRALNIRTLVHKYAFCSIK